MGALGLADLRLCRRGHVLGEVAQARLRIFRDLLLAEDAARLRTDHGEALLRIGNRGVLLRSVPHSAPPFFSRASKEIGSECAFPKECERLPGSMQSCRLRL